MVLTALGEVLATWASVPSVWELPPWHALAAWESALSSQDVPAWGRTVLSPLELVLTAWELTAWVWTALSPQEIVLTAWELPVWGEEVLAAWTVLSVQELPAWGGEVLVTWGPALSAWGFPACMGGMVLNQVIFPCFLRSKLLNLINCLSLIKESKLTYLVYKLLAFIHKWSWY